MVRLRAVSALLVAAVMAGCGSSSNAPNPAEQQALAQLKHVIVTATAPPAPQPGFKIPAARARGLHGLDLWNAVVNPMIKPLYQLNGSAALRDALSPDQYAVYVLFAIDAEYENGGMAQLYYNEGGVFANEGPALFAMVGAPLHGEALAAANRVFWPLGAVPSREETRRRVVSFSNEAPFSGADKLWRRAERREGPIDIIIERFIRRHPHAFFT